MIKLYLFAKSYIKFSEMSFIKFMFQTVLVASLTFGQDIGDLQLDNAASDNFQSLENFNSLGESIINVYSNAAVNQLFIWNTSYQPNVRTFPAKITLPIANRDYIISLYSQAQFNFIENELRTFNLDIRDVSELEMLQNQFEKMKMGTKSVSPVNGVDEAVYLVYCSEDDINCKDGLHWFEKFYVNYYDKKQKSSIKKGNNKKLDDMVKRHRKGVFGMLGFFTLSIFLIDSLDL